MPFASINSTNPRTNPWNFQKKILRIGGAGKWVFFEAAILNFFFRFFCFISWKQAARSYEVSFISAIWMVSSESWKIFHFWFHKLNSHMYTVLHIFRQVLFWAENQVNHQKSLLSSKLSLIFIGMKQKKFKKIQEKNSKWPTKKKLIFQLLQFSIFFCENLMDWSFN